jgi:hypothetical protein
LNRPIIRIRTSREWRGILHYDARGAPVQRGIARGAPVQRGMARCGNAGDG